MKFYNEIRTYMIKKEKYGEDNMEIGYQEDIDDLAILLYEDYDYDSTIEVDPGFLVDVNKKNHLVAIEVVGCADRLGVSKKYVKNAKIEVFVELNEYSYKIIISFNDGEKEIVKRVLK